MSGSVFWELPVGLGLEEAARDLAARWQVPVEPVVPTRWTLLDTFDDRLWQAGQCLIAEQEQEPAADLCLVRREDPSGRWLPGRVTRDALPRWPSELPEGSLRAAVEGPSSIRCWLPRVRVEVSGWQIDVRDGRGKRVVGVQAQRWEVDGEGVGDRIRVQPVRGHDGEARSVEAALNDLGFQPCEAPWRVLREAAGCPPGAYVAQPVVSLSPEERADVGLARRLQADLEVIRANEPGVIHAWDTEFLHDYRIAVRSSRAILKAFRDVWPDVEPARSWLKRLGGWTGPLRDLDVHLLEFDALAATVPASMRPDLEPLRELLQRDQRRAHQALVKAMKSRAYREGMEAYAAWLGTAPPLELDGPAGRYPLGELAGARTWRQFRKVRRRGRAVVDTTPDEVLHDLRKEVKALRYLPTLLAGAMPRKVCKEVGRQVKPLQSVLGELQDVYVQAEAMEAFAGRLVADGAPARTILAMGSVVQHLHERRDRSRAAFQAAFSAWDVPEVAAAYRTLRGPTTKESA